MDGGGGGRRRGGREGGRGRGGREGGRSKERRGRGGREGGRSKERRVRGRGGEGRRHQLMFVMSRQEATQGEQPTAMTLQAQWMEGKSQMLDEVNVHHHQEHSYLCTHT